MSLRVGINGCGRMGRLALRAAWGRPEFDFVLINEKNGDGAVSGHLLEFDSVHGRWPHAIAAEPDRISVDGHEIRHTRHDTPGTAPWAEAGCDLVIEATGAFRTVERLQPYFDAGAKKVVVAAPVKDPTVLNVVVGVNDHLYDPQGYRIVTAASCTTNCIAPAVKVMHESLGIIHGSILTIHDMTNTQSPVDRAHPDLRRARAAGLSLIPTTTGSARDRRHLPRASGTPQWPRVAGATDERVPHRPHLRGRAPHDGRGGEWPTPGCRRRPARRHPRLRRATARLG